MEEMQFNDNVIKQSKTLSISNVMTQVFIWMFVGLIVTGITSYLTYETGFIFTIFSNSILYYGLLIGELVLVIWASSAAAKMSSTLAKILFVIYSIVNGLTMSCIFLLYTSSVIYTAFFAAAAMFGVSAIVGAFIKKDLGTLGTIGMMLLIGVIITTLLNLLIFKSEGLDLFLLYAGIAVFIGLTAFDMQNIKKMTNSVNASDDSNTTKIVGSIAVIGALNLYLDFINIFLRLLSLLGRNKN